LQVVVAAATQHQGTDHCQENATHEMLLRFSPERAAPAAAVDMPSRRRFSSPQVL
jgi:hypothetical protein